MNGALNCEIIIALSNGYFFILLLSDQCDEENELHAIRDQFCVNNNGYIHASGWNMKIESIWLSTLGGRWSGANNNRE